MATITTPTVKSRDWRASDGALHQFDLDEFNIHTPMPASQSAIAQFTPTKPGTYTFYCALHANLATKQGMAGKPVVAP